MSTTTTTTTAPKTKPPASEESKVEADAYVHYHDGGVPGKRRILTGADARPTFTELPRIDMRRMFSSSLADRQELAGEIGAACRDVGFFFAVNHGVDDAVLDSTFEAMEKFFDLPTEVKMETHNKKSAKFRGYEAFLEGRLDPSTRGDLKEGFLMGEDATDPEQARPLTPSTSTPRNQWPTHPSATFFRPAIYAYYTAMLTFSKQLLSIFALALELPEDYFSAISTYPMTNVRAVHYPPQTRDADVGIGAHTDFCWFTLVVQSATARPALEVLNGNGVWVPVVVPEPHAFVVNIGDFLKLVTGGTWQSTVHRVRNMGGEERYSVPFFFSPNEDGRVAVLERFRTRGQTYDEITVGEYFQKRLDIDRTTHLDKGPEKTKAGGTY
ncbi:2OG-Fe(II) oxygenase [Melanomma pulvis-pyrius CBS 109.77]|uniref:2OG-Fe(II) oxygenase n=1 Tax=Melanomma pulvis-pyrius CBS 109.77 TaxID=1314802 RepID=A0A6A6WRX6_9PLEO|nr:2OG-Fe(II) oxygenase [Melanomma pulvis-pyrius CBS 109.77]